MAWCVGNDHVQMQRLEPPGKPRAHCDTFLVGRLARVLILRLMPVALHAACAGLCRLLLREARREPARGAQGGGLSASALGPKQPGGGAQLVHMHQI